MDGYFLGITFSTSHIAIKSHPWRAMLWYLTKWEIWDNLMLWNTKCTCLSYKFSISWMSLEISIFICTHYLNDIINILVRYSQKSKKMQMCCKNFHFVRSLTNVWYMEGNEFSIQDNWSLDIKKLCVTHFRGYKLPLHWNQKRVANNLVRPCETL